MTTTNLRKSMFILFESDQFENIEKMYSAYRYMVNDGSLEIIHNIAMALTNKEKTREALKFLYNAKSTEEFPNPSAFIPELQKLTGIRVFDNIKEEPVYNSPGYNMITVNGNTYDDQMDLVRRANNALSDKVVFRGLIDEIKDVGYRQYLKLLHSISAFDLDYGIEAAEYFVDIKEGIKSLGPYILIVDILEAKQRLDIDADVSKLPVYKKLKNILNGTIYELNLYKIKVWTTDNITYLKGLKDVKARLIASGHKEEDLEVHLKSLQ